MKKIIAVLAAVMMFASVATACGVSDPLNTTEAPTTAEATTEEVTEPQVDINDYSDTFEDLCKYMTDMTYVSGEPTEMTAELIGAKEGKKYSFNYGGGTVTAEFYVFDTENLDETGEKTIADVKANGKFKIGNLPETEAVLSDNGKYLMVYRDTAYDASKPDSQNTIRYNDVMEAFKSFGK